MRIDGRAALRVTGALSVLLVGALIPAVSASAAPAVSGVVYASPHAVQLRLDVYEPPGPGPFPAIVLVHGGGWKGGSRTVVTGEADTLAGAGFVVFAIDYRLSCSDSSDPMCGYHFQAQPQDVRKAIHWVRRHGAAYGADPARVGALGFSAGGDLVYEAGATGTRGDTAPDAVAGWSGSTELWVCTNDDPACPGDGGDPARVNYIGCPYDYAQQTACDGVWSAASPHDQVATSAPPAFIANSTDELVAYQEATDFATRLGELGVSAQLCTVSGTAHATSYENKACSTGSGTVFEQTIAFFHSVLGT
jgi:acetyl esterase